MPTPSSTACTGWPMRSSRNRCPKSRGWTSCWSGWMPITSPWRWPPPAGPCHRGNLNNWGLTHYFKALVSGQQVKRSKPDPEIFLLAAEKLGTDPAHTLVLEDSYNGVRAGAAGGFVTVMVPDLLPADDEMRGLYTMECTSLNEVLDKLKTGRTVIQGKLRKRVPWFRGFIVSCVML